MTTTKYMMGKYLGPILVLLLFISPAFSQSHTHLDNLIARFDSDTDQSVKCMEALDLFRDELKKDPKNPLAVLYVGKAFDKLASIGRFCEIGATDFLRFSDSALLYMKKSDRMQPGIRERVFLFTVQEMMGHTYGSRCLWLLEQGKEAEAVSELRNAKEAGGLLESQIEYCRLLLDLCDSGTILFTVGDDDTFPIMYLQMVQGYRRDVSAMNISLLNLKWYAKLFLNKKKSLITCVSTTLKDAELEAIDDYEMALTKPLPITYEVLPQIRTGIEREFGVKLEKSVQFCLPVYEKNGNKWYCTSAQKFISSVIAANKWQRHVYFATGAFYELRCSDAAVRDAGLAQELYPINASQFDSLTHGKRWFHAEKIKNMLLINTRYDVLAAERICTNAKRGIYSVAANFILGGGELDRTEEKEILEKLLLIPRACLEHAEEAIMYCAIEMYNLGMKEEAKKDCIRLLPYYEKNIGQSPVAISTNEIGYIYALLISGDCTGAKKYISTLDPANRTIEESIKAEYQETFTSVKNLIKQFNCEGESNSK